MLARLDRRLFCMRREYGFRARRYAAPRNDGSAFIRPRVSGGGGPCAAWWRGRLRCRLYVVDEGIRQTKLLPSAREVDAPMKPRPFHRPCGTVPLLRCVGQDKAAASRNDEGTAFHAPPWTCARRGAGCTPRALRGTGKKCQWCRRAMVNRALTSPPLCCFVADAAGGPAIHDVQDDPPI
jgi:hypothetical protein